MKRLPHLTSLHLRCIALAALCVVAGCGRNDIRVYNVPKEKPSLAEAEPGAQPHLRWKLPQGWEEREAGQMRLARFAVTGKDGEAADVSVIPLGGVNAPREQLLNIWREQIHLPPIEADQLTNATPVTIGAATGVGGAYCYGNRTAPTAHPGKRTPRDHESESGVES